MANITKVKSEKIEKVSDLKERLLKAKVIIFTNYRGEVGNSGLNVKELTLIRKAIREAKGELKVVKNTIASRAVEETGLGELRSFFKDPVALVIGYADPVEVAKALIKARDELLPKGKNHLPLIKGAFINGKILTTAEVEELTKLPPQNVLYGKLVGALNSPLYRLVNALSYPLKQFINVISSIKEKKEKEGGE